MKLKLYLIKNRLTTKVFSQMLGIASNTLSLICTGKRMPSYDVAMRIEELTQGEVTADDVMRHCYECKRNRNK